MAQAPSSAGTLRFSGYRRENGRVGVRNHVLILPLDDLSNAASEAVANNIKGTLAIPHSYGRLQFGADLDLHFRTLIGTGSNPNVAAVIVIGIEPAGPGASWTASRKTGKPVEGFWIEQHGDIDTIAAASRHGEGIRPPRIGTGARGVRHRRALGLDQVRRERHHDRPRLLPDGRQHVRQADPQGITGVFGETSEITGGEHICAGAGGDAEVGEKWFRMWQAYQDEVIEAHKTDDLSDSQPTKGNIEGGLTTIEEKALGNLEKIGRDLPLHRRAGAGRGAGARGPASISWTPPRPPPSA